MDLLRVDRVSGGAALAISNYNTLPPLSLGLCVQAGKTQAQKRPRTPAWSAWEKHGPCVSPLRRKPNPKLSGWQGVVVRLYNLSLLQQCHRWRCSRLRRLQRLRPELGSLLHRAKTLSGNRTVTVWGCA